MVQYLRTTSPSGEAASWWKEGIMNHMPYTTNPKLPRLRMQAVLMVRRGHSVRAVARHFGYSHSTVSRWVARAPFDGRETIPTLRSKPKSHPRALAPGLVSAIVEERLRTKRCAEVIQASLARRGITVSLSSVKRTLKRHELVPSRKWKRYRPPVARPPAETPGALVQTDTIHFLDWQTKEMFYLYTVIDLHSRMAHAAVHDHISQHWSYQTILEAQALFGFAFQTVQADNGPEFATWLKDMLKSKDIQLRHSRVRQSNDNAHIERFNRTIQQELLGTRPLRGQVTKTRLDAWLHYYNHDRLHLGIGLKTPKEQQELAARQPA
ncbi:MAG TPA: DDE-type integrase/transposase/recombinase [Verrucomicrobiae bacterium]|nr:DDE-type integrase/transposase/recombinase [Verrucomicrobiae bacterium]